MFSKNIYHKKYLGFIGFVFLHLFLCGVLWTILLSFRLFFSSSFKFLSINVLPAVLFTASDYTLTFSNFSLYFVFANRNKHMRGCRGRDRMVVGFV